LENDKYNFKTLSELGIKDAGTYNVYYQLSAEGYNTFTSEQTIEFTITPIDIVLSINDLYILKSDGVEETIYPNWSRSEGTVLPNESMNLSFSMENFNADNVQVGDVYHINAVAANPNYNVTYEGGYVYVIDYVEVRKDGLSTNYYSNLHDAVANATSGAEIILHKDIELDRVLEINKSGVSRSARKDKLRSMLKGKTSYLVVVDNTAVLGYAVGNDLPIFTRNIYG
jgi:hypothetical protein